MTKLYILPPHPFYIVRHGESEANVRRAMAGGNLDSPLTKIGIGQAKDLANVIHHLPLKPSRIYYSPSQRAKHTAEHINDALKLDMIEVHDLKEHLFGDWENASWDDVWHLVEKDVNPPNGETYDSFGGRISSALHSIFKHHHHQPPMLVAHGGVFRAIMRLYNIKLDKVPNCALYHFEPVKENHSFPWKVTSYKPSDIEGLEKAEIF